LKTVITYGTFDIFHIGHLRLLERARDLGDRLIVGISTDEFNATKGKSALFPFEHRAQIVSSLKVVDRVLPETNWEQKTSDIKSNSVDVFCIGDDWRGKFDYLQNMCEVVYLPRTMNIDSTTLRKLACAFDENGTVDLGQVSDLIRSILKTL